MKLDQRDSLTLRLESLLQKVPEPKQNSLRELIKSLIEPSMHIESLKRLEEKYIEALEQEQSKVVAFRTGKTEKAQTFTPVTTRDRRWLLTTPCLIESESPGETFRMAFELHLRSSRNVFLSWKDIDESARSKVSALKELVACTIFIPDISTVSITEQQAILDLLNAGFYETPHFMGGTSHSPAELKSLPDLSPNFIDKMSQAFLKLSKPVAHYKREGLIRYFLESLS